MKKYIMYTVSALLSGLMISLSLPSDIARLGITLFSFIALVPLLMSTYKSAKKREILWIASIFGITHVVVGRYWLAFFHDYGAPILLAISVWFVFVNFIILFLISKTRNLNIGSRIFAVAWLWTAMEYIRNTGFLADPWALVAYGFGQSRYIVQIIDMTGPMGLTFIAMLSNAIIAQWLIKPMHLGSYIRQVKIPMTTFGFLLLFSTGYGLYQEKQFHQTQQQEGKEAHFVLVQQNINPWQAYWKDLVRAHVEAIRTIEPFSVKPDLIVSSETTLLGDFRDIMRMADREPKELPLLTFIQEMNTYQLFGALDFDEDVYYNSVFLVDAEGITQGSGYHKQRLVPMAEALPLVEWEWLGNLYRRIFRTPVLQMRGKESKLFTIILQSGDTLQFGVAICFEDAFSTITRQFVKDGAELIVNVTNDSWSERVSAEMQHMSIGRYRSIETRRPTLRAANGGMTVHINAFGDYEEMLTPFERGALAVTLNIVERPLTIYTQLGEWFSYLALVISGLYLVVCYSQLPTSSLCSWGKAFFKRANKEG